eukprot:GHVN01074321.1.p1 GENE.GHVN01074321.1~~GHVN01074321.1.p1  ORF type:complete len:636 (-),score=139.29 GHVN01074321.1:4328-5950(-)
MAQGSPQNIDRPVVDDLTKPTAPPETDPKVISPSGAHDKAIVSDPASPPLEPVIAHPLDTDVTEITSPIADTPSATTPAHSVEPPTVDTAQSALGETAATDNLTTPSDQAAGKWGDGDESAVPVGEVDKDDAVDETGTKASDVPAVPVEDVIESKDGSTYPVVNMGDATAVSQEPAIAVDAVEVDDRGAVKLSPLDETDAVVEAVLIAPEPTEIHDYQVLKEEMSRRPLGARTLTVTVLGSRGIEDARDPYCLFAWRGKTYKAKLRELDGDGEKRTFSLPFDPNRDSPYVDFEVRDEPPLLGKATVDISQATDGAVSSSTASSASHVDSSSLTSPVDSGSRQEEPEDSWHKLALDDCEEASGLLGLRLQANQDVVEENGEVRIEEEPQERAVMGMRSERGVPTLAPPSVIPLVATHQIPRPSVSKTATPQSSDRSAGGSSGGRESSVGGGSLGSGSVGSVGTNRGGGGGGIYGSIAQVQMLESRWPRQEQQQVWQSGNTPGEPPRANQTTGPTSTGKSASKSRRRHKGGKDDGGSRDKQG